MLGTTLTPTRSRSPIPKSVENNASEVLWQSNPTNIFARSDEWWYYSSTAWVNNFALLSLSFIQVIDNVNSFFSGWIFTEELFNLLIGTSWKFVYFPAFLVESLRRSFSAQDFIMKGRLVGGLRPTSSFFGYQTLLRVSLFFRSTRGRGSS